MRSLHTFAESLLDLAAESPRLLKCGIIYRNENIYNVDIIFSFGKSTGGLTIVWDGF